MTTGPPGRSSHPSSPATHPAAAPAAIARAIMAAASIFQVEYSRNLVFASGQVMERAFDTVVDRTRARLTVPRLRTLFGSPIVPAAAALTCRLAKQS